MQRAPAVAGQFYPGTPSSLTQIISDLTPAEGPEKIQASAIICPHAGYIYSGGVAAETFARIIVPEVVVILGPNHHGMGAPLAVMNEGAWAMPMGNIEINEPLANLVITNSPIFKADTAAHSREHSLEVQVPFVQYHNPDSTIVPICVSHISYDQCKAAGKALAAAIYDYGKPALIVASTDMTHYESRAMASRKDALAMNHIEQLDPLSLYNTVISNKISMCGIMPTTVALVAAKHLGATQCERVRYTDSGEASGDTDQVVGYAGFVIK